MVLASTKVGCCTVLHKPGDKSVRSIVRAIKVAEKANSKVFKIVPKKYFVELVYSDADYDKKTGLVGVETHRGGYVVKNRIIIISPQVRKLSFDVKSFFCHEINHIFYMTLVGSYHPVWFSEGMATYFMKSYRINIAGWKRFFRAVETPEKYLYYRYMKKKYFKNAKEFYTLGFIVYTHIAKKYGERKVIGFLKDFSRRPSKSMYNKLLPKYFGHNEEDLVRNSIA